MTELNIDPYNFLSTPSIANDYFTKNAFIPNGNLYILGGHIRYFCSKAIHRGRCMTAYNKKWHVEEELADLDSVSLYPADECNIIEIGLNPS